MTPVDSFDPLSLGLSIGRAFDAHGIPYALGGALAFGIWAVPRGTADVDVNAFVHDADLPKVFVALRSIGIDFDDRSAMSECQERGMFVARKSGVRIDIFTPSIPFSWEAFRTRVSVVIERENFWFLSAEALAVFKLLFFRSKDLTDLERLIAVQGSRLDTAYVRKHLVDMMGEDDERTRAWDNLSGGSAADRG